MDKVNVALAAAEDNASAIRELNNTLVRRSKCKVLSGAASTSVTKFGTVTSGGNTGVVVTFPGDGDAELKFGTDNVFTGKSPILAVLPAGTKELTLSGAHTGALALIIGCG